ncbi:MAG: hypothetical protein RL026_991 [Pseudomonadota bacterium]|jgi:hypothetical protein
MAPRLALLVMIGVLVGIIGTSLYRRLRQRLRDDDKP